MNTQTFMRKAKCWSGVLVLSIAAPILPTLLAPAAEAQTYTVLHRFTGGDGAYPVAGVTIDKAGNLYGTASAGGSQNMGTIFRLEQSSGNWSFRMLYAFQGLSEQTTDGGGPYSRPVIGPDGTLYGTTHSGGDGQGCRELHGCGTIYTLKARTGNLSGGWQETVIFQFGTDDGSNPDIGDLAFDHAGNLYGTARNGGVNGWGTVYELSLSSGRWVNQAIHKFAGSPDGGWPMDGPIFDSAGNMYGTTYAGGANGWGTVYQLTPTNSGWVESVLHNFQNGSDGITPISNLILDPSGRIYGATQTGGADGGGTVFNLVLQADGSWGLNTLVGFPGLGQVGPYRSLVMDDAGNLYGTTCTGGAHQWGAVFKLTRSTRTWVYTSLHDFTGGDDGGTPYGSLVLDTDGNLFGTTYAGGVDGNGVVFEITP